MNVAQDVLGVDVAKNWIDVFWLSTGKAERVATAKRELARFAKNAAGCWVVFEASGGYERPLAEALAQAGVVFACINPPQAREVARATGRLAKTDKVDARVLAGMGHRLELRPTALPDQDRTRLAALAARRDDLMATATAHANRLRQAHDPWLRREIGGLVRVLKAHIAQLDRQIEALVAASKPLAAQSRRLRSAPGVGPGVAPASKPRANPPSSPSPPAPESSSPPSTP